MELLKKECKNKRVYALRGEWTQIGIEKTCKNERADTLRSRWLMIGIAKSATIRGFMG